MFRSAAESFFNVGDKIVYSTILETAGLMGGMHRGLTATTDISIFNIYISSQLVLPETAA